MSCIYVGDVGTVFKIKVVDCSDNSAIDISASTLRQIIFKKPTGTFVTKTAVLSSGGVDGYMQYTVIAGDLDMSGSWEIQGYVEGSGFVNSTTVGTFTVSDKLG